jgi:hypothetical protein
VTSGVDPLLGLGLLWDKMTEMRSTKPPWGERPNLEYLRHDFTTLATTRAAWRNKLTAAQRVAILQH